MNKSDHQEKIEDLHRKVEMQGLQEAQNRARSVTVGTCFGGTVEVSMRRADGSSTFAIMQPVEVIELIHQLAAGVGCHIHIQPRKDFSSWRDWKHTEEELAHYRGQQVLPGVGHPPHANDMAPYNQVGANLPKPEQQPGLQPALMVKDKQNETLATEKHKHRRSTKRASAAA